MSSISLQQGNSYTFTIRRRVLLPPDSEAFFVLESEWGAKLLLPAKFYLHYGFSPGQDIVCRVDKVNCSGKVFLEPEHPECKTGDIMDFKVTGAKEIINSFGSHEKLLLLSDPWDQPAWLNISDHAHLEKEKIIACRVGGAKKGQLYITRPDMAPPAELPNIGALHKFIITDIFTFAENYEYYILDLNGENHFVRAKYYAKYGFSKGSRIICRIVGVPGFYMNYLEPLHPDYEPGVEYWFDFINTETGTNDEGAVISKVMLKDLLGVEYSIPYKGEIPRWPLRVRALVQDVRQSKLLLEIREVK